MDKTYAETQGFSPVDWRAEIARGIRGEIKLNSEEYFYLIRLQGWTTCACGNQCAIIPRDGERAPIDGDLKHLGIKFTVAIDCGQWTLAGEILDKIEARSAILIADELAKLNAA